jgi:hypothetical protein
MNNIETRLLRLYIVCISTFKVFTDWYVTPGNALLESMLLITLRRDILN